MGYKDYYKILDVNFDASLEKIREQYLFLIQAWHPDKFRAPAQKAKAEEKTKEINEAYDTLSDIKKRARYDVEWRARQVGKRESIPRESPPSTSVSGRTVRTPDLTETMKARGSCLFGTIVVVVCILGIRKIYSESRRIDVSDIASINTTAPLITALPSSVHLRPTQTTTLPTQFTQTFNGQVALPQNVRARLPTEYEFNNVPSIWDINNISQLDLRSPGTRSYNVTVSRGDKLLWAYYWCAADTATLQANLEYLSVDFVIDDYSLSESALLLSDRNITNWSCRYWVTILSDWESGTVIELDIRYSFSNTVFDGYENYLPGDYSFGLIVGVK
jgi:curved DNA-binding protein CbpA